MIWCCGDSFLSNLNVAVYASGLRLPIASGKPACHIVHDVIDLMSLIAFKASCSVF